MSTYAVINVASGVVESMFLWDGSKESGWYPPEECIAVQTDVAGIGWTYIDEVFIPPPIPEVPPPTPAEILASQSSKLQALTAAANTQKAALANRIATLQDAIDNIGIEGMEEFAATSEEQLEFPQRKIHLTKWKNYAILLGRVTSQAGWPPEVTWPVQPTDGMDLSVSSVET